MIIISLGGVGGCGLAEALRELNQHTYPYDWLITAQSFILQSFNNIANFFIFDSIYVYDTTKLLDKNKKAIMLHDFNNFDREKDTVLDKYKRRFDRLNNSLVSKEELLFVRKCDNLDVELVPPTYYNNIFDREEDDITKWNEFISHIRNKYNKKIKLLLITSDNRFSDTTYENIIIYNTEHNSSKTISNIINEVRATTFV